MEKRGGGHQGNGCAGRPIGKFAETKNVQTFYPGQAGRIADTSGLS